MINNLRNHIEQTGKLFYKFIIEKFKKGAQVLYTSGIQEYSQR